MRRLLIGTMLISFFLSFSAAAFADWDKTFGGFDYDDGKSVQQTTDGGYIIVGETDSYGAGVSDVWLIKTDADGNKLWDKTFGGAGRDIGEAVQQTTDRGYIIAGITGSFGIGYYDMWLIKTDADGNKLWDKTYGGTNGDYACSIEQTTDSGYIIAGYTTSFGAGSYDFYLVKTDANGNKLWDRTFGGTSYEYCFSVQQSADGGYILAGYTDSYGPVDVWLIKTDSYGIMEWDKIFGGASKDTCHSVRQTSDGGYILVGDTYSYSVGWCDIWLIKTDASGELLWDRTFGGAEKDYGSSVQQTTDGGYVIVGYTESFGAGGNDVWLLKTDTNGEKLWDKTFGGSDSDYGSAVQQTRDGRYIIVGSTWSYGEGWDDVWLIKASGPTMTGIDLMFPPDGAVVNSAPVFAWAPDQGTNNIFAIDVSLTPDFAKYYSTYDNLHRLIRQMSWTMPSAIWNKIPNGKTVYWRVRGADLTFTPPDIITSAEVWSFYKP